MVKRLSLFAIGLAMSSCSLLVDNSVFLGSDSGASQRDSGTRDGGTDAGPNAPTPPEIHIEPAEPRTLDDLSVVIDVESSDPLAAGAITLRIPLAARRRGHRRDRHDDRARPHREGPGLDRGGHAGHRR